MVSRMKSVVSDVWVIAAEDDTIFIVPEGVNIWLCAYPEINKKQRINRDNKRVNIASVFCYGSL